MQMGKCGSLMGGEGVVFCSVLEWDGVDQMNRVVEAGAVVLEGQTVPMVVEGEVNQMVGVGVVVLGIWTVPVMVEDAVDRVVEAGVGDLAELLGAWVYWMWIRANGPR